MHNLMVTGGAGFIGSNFVRYMLEKYPDYHVLVYDKLTYAGNLDNLKDVATRFAGRYDFVQGDICDAALVREMVQAHEVDTIINFAAETHVDRSIMDPDAFIKTDVYGTYVLLLDHGIHIDASADQHQQEQHTNRGRAPLLSPYGWLEIHLIDRLSRMECSAMIASSVRKSRLLGLSVVVE